MFQHNPVHASSAIGSKYSLSDSQTKGIKDNDHKSLLSSQQRKI